MGKWVIGNNGSGKTVYLENLAEDLSGSGKTVVTNVKEVTYQGISNKRFELLTTDEAYEKLRFIDVRLGDTGLSLVSSYDEVSTDAFAKLLTLLCRNGDYLVLDEPEYGLSLAEQYVMVYVFQILLPTYKDFVIATHCTIFMSLDTSDWYFCKDYKLSSILEDNLYGYIAKF